MRRNLWQVVLDQDGYRTNYPPILARVRTRKAAESAIEQIDRENPIIAASGDTMYVIKMRRPSEKRRRGKRIVA